MPSGYVKPTVRPAETAAFDSVAGQKPDDVQGVPAHHRMVYGSIDRAARDRIVESSTNEASQTVVSLVILGVRTSG